MIARASENAINPGVVEVGASRRSGALEGSTERSYVGSIEEGVQVTPPLLLGRAHDPRAPIKTLGPSPPVGVTSIRDTWVCSITVGAR